MAAITTTTVLESLRYPNESMIDRDTDGQLWFLKRVDATTVQLFYSNNNGASWNADVSFTRSGLQETSGIFIDSNDAIHMLYRVYESGEDRIYYRRIEESDSGWETERLVTSATAGSAGSVYTGMATVAFKLSSTWYVFYAVGTRNGTNSGVTLFAATINSSGTWTMKNTLIDGYRQWLNGPDGVVHPALDFKHTGNAKAVGSGPALWVAWGRSTLYCIKASWTSGPNWYGPWTPTTIVTGLTNQDYNVGRYNGYGDKFHVAYPNGSAVTVVERKVDDSGGTSRTSPVHPQGVVRYVGLANAATNNSYRVYAVGTSTPDLYYVDWSSGSSSWGSWTLVTATDIVGANPNNFTVRRNNYGNGQYDLVHAGGASPYTLTHTSSTSASAPKTPIITSPENGSAMDVAATLPITWTFSDDDPLDSQLSYAIKRTIGGTTRYWNNGAGTWDVAEVFNSSGTTSKTFSASWGADSDAVHFYSVRVRDQASLTSGYSASVQVIPSGKDNPTLTSPGASVTTPAVTVTWTVATQTAYRVELLKGTDTVYDSGWVSDTAQSIVVPVALVTAGSYTVKVTTRNDEGLTSNTASQAFTTTFTPPDAATVSLTPLPDSGVIRVSILNPTPVGAIPAAVSNTVYRRVVGDISDGVKVADVSNSPDNNILATRNPGFEEATLSGWGTISVGQSTVARTTAQALDGVASAEQTSVNGQFGGVWRNPTLTMAPPVTVGVSYTLSAWIKATAGRTLSCRITWYNAAGTLLSQTTAGSVVANGSWQQITSTGVAPATAAFANPFVGYMTPVAAVVGEKSWIDRTSIIVTGSTAQPITYDDFTVASGVSYEYRVQTVASNGTSIYSSWVS